MFPSHLSSLSVGPETDASTPTMARAHMRRLQSRRAAEQLLPQSSLAISGLVATAPLKLRDDQIRDIDEGLRPHGEGEIEAVDIGRLDPVFHLIGDRSGRTDKNRPNAADADMLGGLPH